jgi:hypothetical protein
MMNMEHIACFVREKHLQKILSILKMFSGSIQPKYSKKMNKTSKAMKNKLKKVTKPFRKV